MKFDFSLMQDVGANRTLVWEWAGEIDSASALVFVTGAAIALIIGVTLAVYRTTSRKTD